MRILRKALITVAVILLAGVGWIVSRQVAPRRTPVGQLPLTYLDEASSLEHLRETFNAASGSTRVIALLSPT